MDQSHPESRFGQAVVGWLRDGCTLDIRSLAAFRICLGLILVADCLLHGRDLVLMFTPDGIFPLELLRAFHDDSAKWSLLFFIDAAWWGGAVLAAGGIAGVLLACGCLTRAASVVGWVVVASVIRRTTPATHSGDLWLACLLFWSMFLPLGSVWSIDAWRRGSRGGSTPPAAVCSVATLAIVLQLVAIYFGAGLAKCNATWFSGEAMSHALSIHDHGSRFGMLLANVPWIVRPLTWTVLAVELAAPLILVACPRPAVRLVLVAAFLMFHAAIWLTMSIGLFAPIGMTAWLPLVPAGVWQAFGSAPRTGGVAGLGRMATWACGCAVALAATSFTHYWGLFGGARLPRPLSAAIAACCLEQEWSMFGAVPPQEQWIYGRATLADGSVVDLLRGGRPLERERPVGGFGSLASNRWHKFFWVLPRPGIRVFGNPTAAALARDWNTRHEPAKHVASLELRFAQQGVAGTDAPLQEMLVAAWPPRNDAGGGNLDRLLETVTIDRDDPSQP
ncbi:MAG: HTTM domain-containing protein [Planctomycetia bacterium]|nr:HTTM domain-containing protein [Planctomycetia bacterium]